MSRVKVVIVTHQSADVIGPCLASCQRWLAGGLEDVIVVDNASRDHTCREVLRWPGVKLLANSVNVGFAAACNQGIRASQAPFYLLLNPDTQLLTSVEPCADLCEQPGVAASTGQLVGEDGAFQAGFCFRRLPTALVLMAEVLGAHRLWPGNPLTRRYRALDCDPALAQAVEQPAGAFLMLRRDVWEQLGGLDERFAPLWFEDVDYCRRLADAGWRILYRPDVQARHTGGHSAGQLSLHDRPVYWYGSLLKYARLHLQPIGRVGVALAVMLAALLRWPGDILRTRSLSPLWTAGSVGRLAALALLPGMLPAAVDQPVRHGKGVEKACRSTAMNNL